MENAILTSNTSVLVSEMFVSDVDRTILKDLAGENQKNPEWDFSPNPFHFTLPRHKKKIVENLLF